jgi:hypothetical protein
MLRTALIPLFVLAAACSTVRESLGTHHTDAQTSKTCFERIKSLSGDWTGPGGEMTNGAPIEVRYRVTAGGSTVEETLFPGTDHEMVTMYHLDGDKLVLTHYCVAGNQPHMVARTCSTSGDKTIIRFGFDGATNMASNTAGHMHEAEMTIQGHDHLTSHWTYFENGKPGHDATFDLTRKS